MLILASASPRRKELLKTVTDFCVVTSDFDESLKDGLAAHEYAVYCARGKAEDVYKKTAHMEGRAVLGADTVVEAGGKILGKPKDKQAAMQMLREIAGKEHNVITGICLIKDDCITEDYEVTSVYINPLSDSEIEEYIKTGSPMDKAGAYGIQDKIINEKLKYIKGSFDNVVGLPTRLLTEILLLKGCL